VFMSQSPGSGVPPVRSTLQENASWVAVWRKARSVATKCFFGVGGSAILSPGDYRAFRIPNTEVKTSRADDTWGASPWQSRSSPGNKRKGYL
jgi:hypothetical protein